MKKEGWQKGELELCGSDRFRSSVKEVKTVTITSSHSNVALRLRRYQFVISFIVAIF